MSFLILCGKMLHDKVLQKHGSEAMVSIKGTDAGDVYLIRVIGKTDSLDHIDLDRATLYADNYKFKNEKVYVAGRIRQIHKDEEIFKMLKRMESAMERPMWKTYVYQKEMSVL